MKNTYVWGIVIVLLVVVGVFWYMNRPAGEAPVSGEQEEEEAEGQEIAIALGEQNDSGMSGYAYLTSVDGGTRVVLDLDGAPENVTQPAHIHVGPCAEIGAAVYPLGFPVNGVSETMLAVSMDSIFGDLPLAINVHKSVEEANVYVACGDIVR